MYASLQFDVSSHGGSLVFGELAAAAAAQGHQPADDRRAGGGQLARQAKGAPWLSSDDGPSQPSATKMVMSMVNKARDLLEKQQQIEQEAQSR